MIAFKRQKNEITHDMQYFAQDQNGQTIAKIKACSMGYLSGGKYYANDNQ